MFKLPNKLLTELYLPCIEARYKICYLNKEQRGLSIAEPFSDVLIITGKMITIPDAHEKLNHWIKKKAEYYFIPMLRALAEEVGVVCRDVGIRMQRSRWGSCSANGDIRLNARLLHYPKEVVRYVMIHELCHLKEFNHSPRFWALVERHEPNYRALKKMLNSPNQFVQL